MNSYSSSVASTASNYDIHEFVRGQKDCRDGVEHQSGNSESYDEGYATQYALEQILSAYTDIN